MTVEVAEAYNLFVGGLSGVFKGLRATYHKGVHNVKNLQNLKEILKRNEVTVLNWGDEEETEILLGYADQQVKIYDLKSKNFIFDEMLTYGEGRICGISKYNGHLLTAVGSGSVCIWNSEDLTSPTSVINTGGPLDCVRHSCTDRNIVAAGGKENDLSLWNLETQQRVFLAKNVRPDELQLRVPVWVSDACFIPDTKKVAVCTRYGHVRLYDPSTPTRRPVVQVEVKEQALMCIAVAPRDHHVVVGSGTGHMYLVDLRGKGLLLNHYKGFVGGIRQIVCTPSEPYIASVGLDRHLRIHNLNTKELLHKEYLQSRLSCILARSSFTMSPDQVDVKQEDEVKQEAESVVDIDSEEEYDALFENMEVVVDKKKRTKKERNGVRSVDTTKVEDDLIKDENESETEIVKEVATDKKKKADEDRRNKMDRSVDGVEDKETSEIEDSENKVKSDDEIETVKEVVTDERQDTTSKRNNSADDCDDKDAEIIEIGEYRNVAESDDEVKTIKEVISMKKPLSHLADDVEEEESDVVEIDDHEDESESDIEVETIKGIIDKEKKLTSHKTSEIEDEDSDVIEVDVESEIEVKGEKEIISKRMEPTNNWRNQSSHNAVDVEDEDSDVIEIENCEIEGDVEMEVEKEVIEKEKEALKDRLNEIKCKVDDIQDEDTDGIRVEDHENSIESGSQVKTVKEIDTDKRTKNKKKRRSKRKQRVNDAKAQETSVKEDEDDSDMEEAVKDITDKVNDSSNISIDKGNSKNNEDKKIKNRKKKQNKDRNSFKGVSVDDSLVGKNEEDETGAPKAKRRKKCKN